jgi:hypothetical protein
MFSSSLGVGGVADAATDPYPKVRMFHIPEARPRTRLPPPRSPKTSGGASAWKKIES